ncbi:TIGR00255 family protein [Desulfonispora thiosulfatigenes DSM 11270]|uniref:TIGR00255 family protein n=1 Tax=Desulfonispora thiosulfatigenes DSM 11270 TaxID=656914 RepID=A0A1W1VIZ2_DESTI|nr:YicC/YloC family endoribonuclease [Desulfonispora thiosulfatigenes]SMB93332.1 TIGR00255 family protein [Desulfonispora thiosulfatigenes DSM 11270]
MIHSMTGYGRGEEEGLGLEFVVEVKSVNHRYSEIVIKQPRQYILLEDYLRKLVQKYISRGRVDLFIKVKEIDQKKSQIKVDKDLAIDYYNSLNELAKDLKISSDVSIYEIASLPEVIKEEENETDLEQVKKVIEKATVKALDGLLSMREAEGKTLFEDLISRISNLKDYQAKIIARSPIMLDEYRERLRKRIEELLIEQVDENRLNQEVIFMVEKSNVTEELIRLDSHFDQFINTLNYEGAVGRKLDFLVQEMNRETNTIGSKANDLEIAHLVVEMKTELEKIREQIQNIE